MANRGLFCMKGFALLLSSGGANVRLSARSPVRSCAPISARSRPHDRGRGYKNGVTRSPRNACVRAHAPGPSSAIQPDEQLSANARLTGLRHISSSLCGARVRTLSPSIVVRYSKRAHQRVFNKAQRRCASAHSEALSVLSSIVPAYARIPSCRDEG